MCVGPTGGGKTTIYEILKEALICLHKAGHKHYYYQPVHTYVFNPKVGWGRKGEGAEGEREKVEKVYLHVLSTVCYLPAISMGEL